MAVRWALFHPAVFLRHIMYLCIYLDDSDSAGNKDEDYLVLGGISVFERQVYWLSKQLDELAALIWHEDPQAVEFHASEIYRGKTSPWDTVKGRDERRKVIKDVLAVLANDKHGTTAFACAVHKSSFPNRDPMEVAFEQLCNRFDLQLRRMHNQGDTQRGLIVLDESSYETTLQQLARDFRTIGSEWGLTKNIADVPLFVDSKASRCVQLADHVAYSVFRRFNAKDTQYLDLILPKFDQDQGKIHGLVHYQTYDGNCMCPACMSRKMA